VLLLEYLEERPLLLLQPGMGMRLTTYYRQVIAALSAHGVSSEAALQQACMPCCPGQQCNDEPLM
jgi:uncharacterized protein